MLIGGLQKLTLIDFPGKIACTVFTVGCNFRCHFCHNPELIDSKKFKLSEIIEEKNFFDFLDSRHGLLDGVCITGGEPTLYRDLPEFLKKIKALGFLVKLDTNGTNPEMLAALISEKLIDYIAMDVKTSLKKDLYEKVTGAAVDLENIKKSIALIAQSGLEHEFRTTIVPGLHAKEDILDLAEFIKGAKKYYLQQFRAGEKILNQEYKTVKPYPAEFLGDLKEEIKGFFEVCEVRD
ncbi:anaerobic ribonucleoside-triphosphate reductase activating protein [Candidatus Falkowbacteria bacterium]|nr:anaerobic ribonucleoside-triphosphate reductase activating protein [Candidatus Falkowbacteria bacterium]